MLQRAGVSRGRERPPLPDTKLADTRFNSFKYRPTVTQVESSFGNPQPGLPAVRVSILLLSSLLSNGTLA